MWVFCVSGCDRPASVLDVSEKEMEGSSSSRLAPAGWEGVGTRALGVALAGRWHWMEGVGVPPLRWEGGHGGHCGCGWAKMRVAPVRWDSCQRQTPYTARRCLNYLNSGVLRGRIDVRDLEA